MGKGESRKGNDVSSRFEKRNEILDRLVLAAGAVAEIVEAIGLQRDQFVPVVGGLDADRSKANQFARILSDLGRIAEK